MTIEQIYQSGVRQVDLAKYLGINRRSLYYWKKTGIPKRRLEQIKQFLSERAIKLNELS